LNAPLARDINQANISAFIEFIDGADDDTLLRACIAVGDGICSLSEVIAGTADLEDIDIYEDMTMRDLAGHFVDEGLFGEIPEALQNYIDLDAIARDLSMDYATTTIDGTAYIYRGRLIAFCPGAHPAPGMMAPARPGQTSPPTNGERS
jgi:hypothetical protein